MDFLDINGSSDKQYVVESNAIMVFPCAHRVVPAVGSIEQSYVQYSQLMTEYNLTHLQGTAGTFNSYIIKDDNTGFTCMIGGYLICLVEQLDARYEKLGIKVYRNSVSDPEFANVLVDPTGTDPTVAVLDREGYFYGVHFLTNKYEEEDPENPLYTHILDRSECKSAIARYDENLQQLYLN